MVSIAYAMGQGGAPEGGAAGYASFIPLILMFVIFYFLLIRPQQKKQKDHEKLVAGVKTGDKVVTAGGIHGIVANVKETTFLLKVADNVKLEVDKNSIASVSKAEAA